MIQESFSEAIVAEDELATPKALLVSKDSLHEVCDFLYTNDKTYFDSLSCMTAIDNGVEKSTVEIAYNLYSIPFDIHLMIKVELDRDNPSVVSVSDIWRTADWHEREAFDLVGIHFNNHPDLRRILLPDDWEGHPLRRDYVEQERYHDVKVKY